MTEQLLRKQLLDALNDTFILPVEIAREAEENELLELPLKLVEVTDLKERGKYESYSSLFHGPPSPLLPQQIYCLRHQSLGEQKLFLVPVGADDECCKYETVISRLKGEC